MAEKSEPANEAALAGESIPSPRISAAPLAEIFSPLLRIGVERLESDWCLATENANFVLTPELRGFAPKAFGAHYGNAGLEGAQNPPEYE